MSDMIGILDYGLMVAFAMAFFVVLVLLPPRR